MNSAASQDRCENKMWWCVWKHFISYNNSLMNNRRPAAPVGTHHLLRSIISSTSHSPPGISQSHLSFSLQLSIRSTAWRKCPPLENTWPVCGAHPVCNILKWFSALQKVAEQDSGDAGAGSQPQSLVTKSRRNLYRPCSLARQEAPAEIYNLPGSGVHSGFPGQKALGEGCWEHSGQVKGLNSAAQPWGWVIRNLWPIYQDLLLNGLGVWASLKLCPGGLVIKYQALQTGAGETTLSLFNQDRSLRYRARRCGTLPCSLPPLHTHVSSHLGKHSHINPLTAHTCVLTPKSVYFYSTPLFMHDAHSLALMKAYSAHTQTHLCTHTPKPFIHPLRGSHNPQILHTSQYTSSRAIHLWSHRHIPAQMAKHALYTLRHTHTGRSTFGG